MHTVWRTASLFFCHVDPRKLNSLSVISSKNFREQTDGAVNNYYRALYTY